MKNNSAIILVPYVIGFLLLYTIAFPLYSGGGLPIFNSNSTLYLMTERENLQKGLLAANNISKNAESEYQAYLNLSDESKNKLEIAVPSKIDFPRIFNEISEFANRNGVRITAPEIKEKASQANDSSNLSGVKQYDLNFIIKSDNYEAIKKTVEYIENNLAFYNIELLSFKENIDLTKKELDYSFTVRVYELKN